MEEIWKGIEGYEGLYQVSNLGNVRSLDRYVNNKGKLDFRKGKILKGCKDIGGYLVVNLYKEGKEKKYKIHRLVGQAFLDNQNNLSEINHKDENKTNNMVDNLEWCDRSYNINYGTHNEKVAKVLSIPILQFNKTGDFIRKWNSATEVEREIGISQGHISECLKGKLKSAYGYKWGYAEDYEKIPFKVFDLEMYRKKVG